MSDTDHKTERTATDRPSFFDLLDRLRPKGYERKPRSSKEARFRADPRPPENARDLAAQHRYRR